MGKVILYLWVETHPSMPKINIVFRLRFSARFLLPHLSNCDDGNKNKPALWFPRPLLLMHLLKTGSAWLHKAGAYNLMLEKTEQ